MWHRQKLRQAESAAWRTKRAVESPPSGNRAGVVLRFVCVFGYPLILALAASPSPAPSAAPAPPCTTVEVTVVDTIDSSRAKAGDGFRFETLGDVPGAAARPPIPKGTVGYGLVMLAHHNGNRGKPGFMVIDARFVVLADGTHVPVAIVPDPSRDAHMLEGMSVDAPGFLGFIPYASIMTGAYNTIHRGHEIVVAPGTHWTLVVGDDLEMGECTIGPTPSAAPSPRADATPRG